MIESRIGVSVSCVCCGFRSAREGIQSKPGSLIHPLPNQDYLTDHSKDIASSLPNNKRLLLLHQDRVSTNHSPNNLRFQRSSLPISTTKPKEPKSGFQSLGRSEPTKKKDQLSSQVASEATIMRASLSTLLTTYTPRPPPTDARSRALLIRSIATSLFACGDYSKTPKKRPSTLQLTDFIPGELSVDAQQPPATGACFIRDRESFDLRLIEAANSDRLLSFQVQAMIHDPAIRDFILDSIERHAKQLICSKFGCHILREAVSLSTRLLLATTELARSNLLVYACDEHSSRVLQTLAKLSRVFAISFLEEFLGSWSHLSTRISAIFLFAVCLVQVCQDEEAHRAVKLKLRQVCRKRASAIPKHHKRVLVSFLETCTEADLHQFYLLLRFEDRFVQLMDDKYMVYILMVFLNRRFERATRDTINAFRSDSQQLLASKFFKFMLEKLFRSPHTPISACLGLEVSLKLEHASNNDYSSVSEVDQIYLFQVTPSNLTAISSRTIENIARLVAAHHSRLRQVAGGTRTLMSTQSTEQPVLSVERRKSFKRLHGTPSQT